MKNKKVLYLFAGLIVVFISIFNLYKDREFFQKKTENNIEEKIINSVIFTCSENKSIQADFFKNKVNLVLKDGRKMSLPQTVSVSGARYANEDESFIFWNKGDTAFVEEKGIMTFKDCAIDKNIESGNKTQVGNPASINCEKVGGHLIIEKRGDGGEYGLCYFEDNRACEEWALMRGDCPYGGMKTTGYDTIDQKYCAWLGGTTSAVKDSVCVFKNGKKCPTELLYKGMCTQ